ncbi:MAG: metallophosphoesterase [Elusimicrobiota bacterium]|jgi:hypothetical protein|nr:metallophosphoesterase [Elusimicrobiota bacterium]
MKKFLYLTVLFLFATAAANAAQIVRGPYTEDPEQTTAVIKWAANEPTASWLEYGPEGKCSQLMLISSKKMSHSTTLHGLIPNTQFCYKVYVQNNAGNGVQAPFEGTFKTLSSPERKIVNFMVLGKTSDATFTSKDIKNAMAQSMAAYNSDFLIHTGDIASNGTPEATDAEFFTYYQSVLKNNPLLIALGEAEYGPNRASAEGKYFLSNNYKKIHSMPWSKGTPNYYYIDTANARLIFIDTNNLYEALAAPSLSPKSSQYEWLKKSLATTDNGKWKIVIMHHPVYSSGATPDLLSHTLAPLFEAQKVNLVIQGHQGAYERTKPIRNGQSAKSGPIYLTIGGGNLLEPASYKNEWTAKYYELPHFAQIGIVDRKLSIRVFTHENKRIDALDIYF